MSRAPAHVEVLDPIDRWLHAGAALGVLGTLATGPLLQSAGVGGKFGTAGGVVGIVHALSAAVGVAAWVFHLARVCLLWLEGRNPWSLLPRMSDLRDLGVAVGWGLGLSRRAPPGVRFSYRERLSYLAMMGLLPLLAFSGWVVAHPLPAASFLSPQGILKTAGLHSVLGLLLLVPLAWHLYFVWLRPSALFWNPAWLTGRVGWARLERMWPEWARDFAGELEEEEPAEEAPTVESLLEQGNRAAREGRYEVAAAVYETALELYPGYSQALFNLGVARYRLNDRSAAAAALRHFLEQDPFGEAAPKARDLLAVVEAEAKPGGAP